MPTPDLDIDGSKPSSELMRSSHAPILVTGAHRSGSTWVGRMLAATPEVGYIKEPFHLEHRPGVCAARFERWFTYVTDENAAGYDSAFARTLAFDYDVAAELKSLRSPKDAARMSRDWVHFAYHRRRGSRPLMKDPLAFFSAEWLAERFAMDVVVIVRHPAAFVSSLSRVGWWYDVRQWLDQPLLMRDLLGPFEDEIRAHAGHEQEDMIAHAALLWKVIYAVARHYREQHPEWTFVRHEDLSRRPTSSFRALYDQLALSFTSEVKEKIEAYSGVENPAEVQDGRVHQLRRDSRANIWNWAERLTPSEVDQIRRATDDVASAFYAEQDWTPPDTAESGGSRS